MEDGSLRIFGIVLISPELSVVIRKVFYKGMLPISLKGFDPGPYLKRLR